MILNERRNPKVDHAITFTESLKPGACMKPSWDMKSALLKSLAFLFNCAGVLTQAMEFLTSTGTFSAHARKVAKCSKAACHLGSCVRVTMTAFPIDVRLNDIDQ